MYRTADENIQIPVETSSAYHRNCRPWKPISTVMSKADRAAVAQNSGRLSTTNPVNRHGLPIIC